MLDLSSLNAEQKKAVTAPLGPVLVLAGAGSGKTRVLSFRVAYLIEQNLIPADRILALTFTNKAAKEMQSRVHLLLNTEFPISNFQFPNRIGTSQSTINNQQSAMPHMGTFHSVGARILRREIQALGYTRSFIIFDSDDSLKVIKEICQELSVNTRFPPSLFRSLVSQAKNLLQTPDTFNIGLEEPLNSIARQVYVYYQNYLFQQNAVDFDDLLLLPIKIFEAQASVLKKYQDLFQYVLVDEYQDTNPAQYQFLKLITGLVPSAKSLVNSEDTKNAHPAKHLALITNNLFVVGDDAQSIYGFRGSDIRNILNFEKDFPTSLVVALEQNYRSTKHILAAASKVIALSPEQKKKTLWTENSDGEKVRVEETSDETAEAELVARQIIKLSTPTKLRANYESIARSNLSQEQIASPSIPVDPDDGRLAISEDTYEEEETKPFSILDQFLKKAKRSGSVYGGLKLPATHSPLSEFAVLYRTHAQSRSLEEVFIAAGIPYHIVGGVKFYERKEIKDLLAYVRLVINFRDMVSLKRVINVPARGIGQKGFEILKDFIKERSAPIYRPSLEPINGQTTQAGKETQPLQEFIDRLRSIPMPLKQRNSTLDFFNMLYSASQFNENETLDSLIRWLIKKNQLEKCLRDGTEVGETRWENVEELVSVASEFSHMPWQEGAQEFLEEVALFTDIDTVEDQKDAVTLMTLHSAKGLEFDTVFFVGLEEGVLPHSRSLFSPPELAEEIRLAYVGLTRARKKLFLTYAKTRTIFGHTQIGVPSRILQALPEEAVEFRGSSNHVRIATDGELTYESAEF